MAFWRPFGDELMNKDSENTDFVEDMPESEPATSVEDVVAEAAEDVASEDVGIEHVENPTRKRKDSYGEEEITLFMKCEEKFGNNWHAIAQEMRENADRLSPFAREVYLDRVQKRAINRLRGIQEKLRKTHPSTSREGRNVYNVEDLDPDDLKTKVKEVENEEKNDPVAAAAAGIPSTDGSTVPYVPRKRKNTRELMTENQEKMRKVMDRANKMLKSATKASKYFISYAKSKGVDVSSSSTDSE